MAIPKLISIISEEVNNFLNEIEYRDEDIINADSINLQHEYDKLNQQLFNNELPKILLRWSNRKTSLGHVSYVRNRLTGRTEKINGLSMSLFYETPYRIFKSTLAHEMIHIFELTHNERGSHGYFFQREARRINNMNLGFNITATNTEHLEMTSKTMANAITKRKTLIAMIMNIDGKYYINVTTPSVYQAESDSVFSMYEKFVNAGKYRNVEITVVESENPALMQYPISRTFKRRISYSALNDELLGSLLDEKILKNIKFKRGVPMSVSEDIESSDNNLEVVEII